MIIKRRKNVLSQISPDCDCACSINACTHKKKKRGKSPK